MQFSTNKVSEKELEAALHSVAKLVASYGDKYWPIFERLESELDDRRSRSKRLSDALRQISEVTP